MTVGGAIACGLAVVLLGIWLFIKGDTDDFD